jgi:hypothetical protein
LRLAKIVFLNIPAYGHVSPTLDLRTFYSVVDTERLLRRWAEGAPM